MNGQTYLIAGPTNAGPHYFAKHYVPMLDFILQQPTSRFVMRAAPGVSLMAQEYFMQRGIDPARVTLYMVKGQPREGAAVECYTVDDTAEKESDCAARMIFSTSPSPKLIAVFPSFCAWHWGSDPLFEVLLDHLQWIGEDRGYGPMHAVDLQMHLHEQQSTNSDHLDTLIGELHEFCSSKEVSDEHLMSAVATFIKNERRE